MKVKLGIETGNGEKLPTVLTGNGEELLTVLIKGIC